MTAPFETRTHAECRVDLRYLNERPLGELLVDLRLVHDVFGPAGVLEGAQRLLHTQPRLVSTITRSETNTG